MSNTTYECVHCGRDTFTSQRGLTQHLQRNAICANKFRMADIQNSGYYTANEGMLYTGVNMTSTRRSEVRVERSRKHNPNNDACTKDRPNNKTIGKSTSLSGKMCQPCFRPDAMEEEDEDQYMTAREDNDGDIHNNLHYDDDDNLAFDAEEDSADEMVNPDQQRKLMLQFREYTDRANREFVPLTRTEVTAIKCLSVLRKTSASLGTYKDVMEWHLKETGALKQNETVGETPAYKSQKKVLDNSLSGIWTLLD